MVPQYVDISHFRQPYKNAVFSGFGDAASDAANAAIMTAGPDGVKTLVPAAGILVSTMLTASGAQVMTTAADKEQIMLLPPGAQPSGSGVVMPSIPVDVMANWVNKQLGMGRSVILSTNAAGGLASVLSTPVAMLPAGTQIVLAAVSTHADEIAGAGPSMPGAALIAPSKLGAAPVPALVPGAPMKAGIGGPVAAAVVALIVVGGVYYAFRKKPSARRY